MSKIRSDSHGLYVRAGGNVFRPIETQYSYPIRPGLAAKDGLTQFSEGSEVRARHVGGTTFASIRNDEHEEYWHSHGSYYDQQGLQMETDLVWQYQQD